MQIYSCPVCGSAARGLMEPCEECLASVSWPGRVDCSLCGMDLAGSDDPCPSCRGTTPIVDGISCLGHWSGALREWLSDFKYGGDSRLSHWLGRMLAEEWAISYPGVPVVPVPPRPGRRFFEGRDPVGLLARRMAIQGVPLEILLARRGNKTQKSLTRAERLAGQALKYRLKRGSGDLRGRYVLLDDVMTTGATLRSCAAILKNSGADRVYGLVVCRD